MPVLVDNPRYERLAQMLAAGMRQSDICRELDYTETHVSQLKETTLIRNRLQELLIEHSQTLSSRDAVSVLERRKARLQEIVDHPIETPVSAGHRVAAAKELNLMEKVYTQGNQGMAMIAIQVILPSAQSAQSLPETPEIKEIEAKKGDITSPVRTSEAKKLPGKHVYTEEEKAQLYKEVFGDEQP